MKNTNKLTLSLKKHRDILIFCFTLGIYFVLATIFELPCIIKALTGISCPGCGMSRALISLIKLDFKGAFYYHPLIFLLIPIAITICILSVKKLYKTRKIVLYATAVLFIAVYLYRFIILKSPVLVFAPQDGLLFFPLSFLFKN